MQENQTNKNTENEKQQQENDEESEFPKKVGDYVLIDQIGKGTFSQVTRAIHLITNQLVAVKILDKSKIEDDVDLERILREIEILEKISHPNIVQIYEVYSTIHNYYIIMEIIEGCDLFDYIISKNFLDEYESCYFFRQLISVLEYLISIGICHRDIKPENILLDKKNQNIKIIDFGLSNYCNNNELLSSSCGSPCYASPEMISGKPYQGITTDIWSSGIVLYSMLVGALPFDSNELSDLYEQIKVGKFYIPSNLSMNAIDLLKKILEIDFNKRIKLNEIKNHPWFSLAKNELYKGVNSVLENFPVDENIVKYIMKKYFKDDSEINYDDCVYMVENMYCNKYTTTYLICQKYDLMENDKELEINKDDDNKSENENKNNNVDVNNIKIEGDNCNEIEKNNENKNKPIIEKKINLGKYQKEIKNKNSTKKENENKNVQDNVKILENENINEHKKKEIQESKKISENENKKENEQECKKFPENKDMNEIKNAKEKKKILENKNMNENKNNSNNKIFNENINNHENTNKNIQQNKKILENKSSLENKKNNENRRINENKNELIKNALKEIKKISENKNISKNKNNNENKNKKNNNVKNITIYLIKNKSKEKQKDKSKHNKPLNLETKNLNKKIVSRNNGTNYNKELFSPFTIKNNYPKNKLFKYKQNRFSIDLSKKNILLEPIININKHKNSTPSKTNKSNNNGVIYSNFKRKLKLNKNEENTTFFCKEEKKNSVGKKSKIFKTNFFNTIYNDKKINYNIYKKNHQIINSNSNHLYKRKIFEIKNINRTNKEKSEDEIKKDNKNFTITGKSNYLDLNYMVNSSMIKDKKKANSQNLKHQKSNSLNKSINNNSNYYNKNRKITFFNYQQHINKFMPGKRVSVFNEKFKEINKKLSKINIDQSEKNTVNNTITNKSKKKSPKNFNIHFFTNNYNQNAQKKYTLYKRKTNSSKYESKTICPKNESTIFNINNNNKTKIRSRNNQNKNIMTLTHTTTFTNTLDKNSNCLNHTNTNTCLKKQKTIIKGNIINKIFNKSAKKDVLNNNLNSLINIPINSGENSIIYICLSENGVIKKIEKNKKEVKRHDKKEDKKNNDIKNNSKTKKQVKNIIKTNIDLYS